jgi:hypothetical protein
VCDLDTTGVQGAPSIFKIIRSGAVLSRMLLTLDLNCEEKVARSMWNWTQSNCVSWKFKKSGQFPDDLVKIEGVQIHCVTYQPY